jgi:lysophospholipase L1-like esterase
MGHQNNKIITILLLLCCLFSFTSSLAKEKTVTPYNRIVFFGDSMTDNGNIYAVDLGFLPKSPPYYQGRFSNDVVWSERVADRFASDNVSADNYAFGGLTAVLRNPTDGFLPYTITGSMYDYLARSILSDRTSTLFIIWVGANDYLQGSNNVEQETRDVVNNIKYVIESLIYYGGSNFLIINLPDLSKTPYSHANNMDQVLGQLVQAHNKKLAAAVNEVENSYKQVNIHLFDVNQLFIESLADIDKTNKKYNTHLSNLTESCWQGGYTLRKASEAVNASSIQRDFDEYLNTQGKSKALLSPKANKLNTSEFARYIANTPDLAEAYAVTKGVNELGQALEPCANPNDYVFWDHIHPTGPVHSIVARNMIDFIEANYQIRRN